MTREIENRYLAQVDRALVRLLRLRERLMDEAKRLVDQFLEENPEATYEDLLTAFGTPEEFAEEMLSTLPTEEVEGAWRKEHFWRRAALVLTALVLAGSALFFFWRWQKTQKIVNGDFKVVISPVEEVTDEELEGLLKDVPIDAQSVDGGK